METNEKKFTSEEIDEVVENAINDAAFKRLSQLPEEAKKELEKKKMTKSQTAKDVDDALFGVKKTYDEKFNLRENIDVSNAEIESFKDDLISHLIGHSVSFDIQVNDGVKTVADFHNSEGTIDASISGQIDNDWLFTFSLKNGLIIKADSVEITNDNKELTSKLYNLYNNVFKTKFAELIVN